MTPATTLDDTAAHWALRLSSGPLTPDEASLLRAWLEADPANTARLESFQTVYAGLAETVPAMVRAGELPSFEGEVIRPSRFLFRRLATVSAVAAALALSAFWWVRRPEPYATQIAQRSSLTLADGSHVDLNARTSLAVQLRGSERHVQLTSGEAYFAVAKDGRPFFVETPSGTIRVTGTAFNVRTTAEQLEVTVLEGAVGVSTPAGADQLLKPQDQLTVQGASIAARRLSATSAENVIAWREGRVAFEGEPLAQAVERFAHYHGREFIISPEVRTFEVGGRFRLDDLNAFLDGIEVSLPIIVLRSPGGPIRIVAR